MSHKSLVDETKAARLLRQEQLRKSKREAMLMARRGLNFVTEHTEANLDEASISVVETETDNVAPKIVGILGLGESCDIHALKNQLIGYCEELRQSMQKPKKDKRAEIKAAFLQGTSNEKEQEMTVESSSDGDLQAYIIPNAGGGGMGAKKQRVIFRAIDRTDVYDVLDTGKVADLVLMVMSCASVDATNLKNDPDISSGAIDEAGYRALSMLRSQGTMSLIGVLQHLEKVSSKKQPQIKRLF